MQSECAQQSGQISTIELELKSPAGIVLFPEPERVTKEIFCSAQAEVEGENFCIALPCSVISIFDEFVYGMVKKLREKFINFPTGKELKRVVIGFQEVWGFPQRDGAVDGTHISILAPENNLKDYYNRKNFHSIHAQLIVDHEYIIRSILVEWSGSVHDARVFGNSAIYNKIRNGEIFTRSFEQNLEGQEIRVFLVGDSTYPLTEHVMKPYRNMNLTQDQQQFNYRLSRTRVVVECAIGRLKGNFQILRKQERSH
ncbi:unnamed protein product [Didymodactylos carnosus]|uniref:DDE Tnp4 domain-containing protein n=1 Tax=Didymodactylos carnosus TaxID=1234261 RepID=A0A814I4C0_9BILA|nr:unnamed protein product [Didymodactylos carnosus]CAF3791720.1 unnamed protein product [Didymodactylos carnosus]